jgi:hypothetical protein
MKVDEPVQHESEYRVTTVPPAIVPLMVNGVQARRVEGAMIGVAHAPFRVTENTVRPRGSHRLPILCWLCNTHHV